MLGAITGDICASPYEGGSCLPDHLVSEPAYRFKFFGMESGSTDDTVCTIAIADAMLTDKDFATSLRNWVARYPGRGYGGMFTSWATSVSGPYNSLANGAAMRVSPCALLATSLENAEELAKASAMVTHNHPDGVLGAVAIAAAIWWARAGATELDLRRELTARFGYNLPHSVAHRAQSYRFSTWASETVPDALLSAIEARSWKDSVVNSVWIGGDSDTIACMAGGIAEARFGLPRDIAETAMSKLPLDMQEVLIRLYDRAEIVAPWDTPPKEELIISHEVVASSVKSRLAEFAKNLKSFLR